MQGSKNPSTLFGVRNTLTATLIFIAALSLGFGGPLVYEAFDAYRSATRIEELNQVADYLFQAVKQYGYERGRTNVVLNDGGPVAGTEKNRNFVSERRKEGDRELGAALDRLPILRPTDHQALTAKVLLCREAVRRLRTEADRDMIVEERFRDPNLPRIWFQAMTEFIESIGDLLFFVSRDISDADGLIARLTQIKLHALGMRDTAGPEISRTAATIKSNSKLSDDELRDIMKLHGATHVHWVELKRATSGLPYEDISKAMEEFQEVYSKQYQPVFADVFPGIKAGGPYEITQEEILKIGGKVLEAIAHIMDVAVTATDQYALHMKSAAHKAFALRLTMLLANILLILLCILFIHLRVTAPITGMTQVMKRLARGDHDVAIPGAERRDEIGDMAGAVIVFKQNALQLAAEMNALKEAEETIRWNQQRLEVLAQLGQMTGADIRDLCDFALEKSIELTRSKVGYFYLYCEDTKQLTLYSRSKDVMGEGADESPKTVCHLDDLGPWGEAVRQRRAIITNDDDAPNPSVKGYPDREGHSSPRRHLSKPFFEGDRIVGVLGVADKEEDYDDSDILELSLITEGLWRIVSAKQSEMALQKSEERLALALRATDDGVWDWDLLCDERYYSPRCWSMVGYPEKELDGTPDFWRRLVHPEDLDRVEKVFTEAIAEGTSFEVESRLLHKNGHYVPILTRGFILRDETRRAVRASGTHTDLTERKRAEEERRRWEERLQQARKAESLARMAGAIAHNFNNMLGAVIGNLELALEDVHKSTRLERFVGEAMKASYRAAEISRFMLTYLGQTTGKSESVDLVEALNEVFTLLSVSLPAKVHLKTDLPLLGPIVRVNGTQLKQILINLISNAVEAIGEGEGNIALSIRVMAGTEVRESRLFPLDWERKTGSYACLSVADTGCGMDGATLNNIFDPFFSTKFTGRGLGLPTVLGVLRMSGGAIAVESRPGQGTTFRVFLPMPEVESGTLPMPEELVSALMAHSGRVLVVDDEAVVRNMTESMLKEMLGYEVVTASNGTEAVEIFRRHKDEINLVLLDLSMPGMNGWATLSALRALRPDIPVILASGYDEAQVMSVSCPERPQAFLHKPYGVKDLKAAIVAAGKV